MFIAHSTYLQDSYRLPEGICRIGYDADTQCYTFRDYDTGQLYTGAPGEHYGVMQPVSKPPSLFDSRDVRNSTPQYSLSVEPDVPSVGTNHPKSFQEFLPSALIASPSESNPPTVPFTQHTQTSGSTEHLPGIVQVARRATLPRMRGVVRSLKRSLTVVGKGMSSGTKQEWFNGSP